MKFHYDMQIESQPDAVEAVLRRPVPRLDSTRPLLFCGQGTSLHAARVAAAWAGYPALAVEALQDERVLRRERFRGLERLRRRLEHAAVVEPIVGQAIEDPPDETLRGRRLAGKDPLLVTGFGLDAIAAAEAALKLKEATFQWAEGLSVEQALHGPQAALHPRMGAVLFNPDDDDGGRTARLRELCVTVGVEVVDIRVARCSEAVRPLVSIVPAQRLAAEIARLTGGDPDRSRNPV